MHLRYRSVSKSGVTPTGIVVNDGIMDRTTTKLSSGSREPRSRSKVLEAATALFYAEGVRAVGMERIVETSRVAKTTIYRHFPTKDALVEAFLENEDAEFWEQWELTIGGQRPDEQIAALCAWVGERILRPRYRGCPQINVAAEFANDRHPARVIGRRHKAEMHRRLVELAAAAGAATPADTGSQIALLFDGAFVSGGQLVGTDASRLLKDAARRLIQ